MRNERNENRQQVGPPPIMEGFRYSKGARVLVEQAQHLGIDPTSQITRALEEISASGKRTITREHLGGLPGIVVQMRHQQSTNRT